MLYYGDRARTIDPRREIVRLRRGLTAAARRTGLARHERLVGALVDAGVLAQALADAGAQRGGGDVDDPAADAALALTLAIARAAWSSWASGLERAEGVPEAAWDRLAALDLPGRATAVEPEGYTHYALYPEAYGEAARALAGRAPLAVIGIRSVGTSLAAMVAAAAGGEALLATVRPGGHPWRRRLVVGGALEARLRTAIAHGARFAVADEGPGLSGSSFLAVVRWLEERGAPSDRVALLPGHRGPPGSRASDEGRRRWDRAERLVAPFEGLLQPRVLSWVEASVGRIAGAEDVSRGRWRALARPDEASWPAIFAQQERRKLLVRAEGRRFLLRFAGLGRHGRAALRRARALAEARLSPPVLALVHGFLVQPWIERTRPLGTVARGALLARVTRYLAFRARAFPAGAQDGASPERLLEVLEVNASEALGAQASRAVRRLEPGARAAAILPRCRVDAKLEPWEWLVTDRDVLKADALDHASGHDLVGCQPIAWDVAGARVELGLSAAERDELAARLGRSARLEVPAEALDFLEAAYLAHRIGRFAFARAAEGDPAERIRIEARLRRYRRLLRARLG